MQRRYDQNTKQKIQNTKYKIQNRKTQSQNQTRGVCYGVSGPTVGL